MYYLFGAANEKINIACMIMTLLTSSFTQNRDRQKVDTVVTYGSTKMGGPSK